MFSEVYKDTEIEPKLTLLTIEELGWWLIDDVMFWCDNFCLITWLVDSRFLLQQFDTGNRWIRVLIDYHPCITSEATNQVC